MRASDFKVRPHNMATFVFALLLSISAGISCGLMRSNRVLSRVLFLATQSAIAIVWYLFTVTTHPGSRKNYHSLSSLFQ
jgi:hypothetical protein